MNRDQYIDSLKGFLILLVILGHLIGSLKISWIGTWNLIYTFHMPLFILISGYFSKKDCINIRSIIEPLIIFQVINIALLSIIGNGFTFSYFFIPHWTLWYLLSLLFWRLILKFTPNWLINRPYLYLVIAFIISLFVGVILQYGRVLSIQRTISFLPFFLMGYYFKKEKIRAKLWNNTLSKIFLAIVCLACFMGYYPNNANILLRGADSYTIQDLPAKIFIITSTLICVYSLWNLKYNVPFLAKIGKNSLSYYLYHGIIIEFLIAPIVRHYDIPTNFIYIFTYFLLIILMIYLMNRFSIFKWLVNPNITKTNIN